MAQLAVGSPFSELDLCDEPGLHPVWALVGCGPHREGTLVDLERLQELHQPLELLLVEAGSRVTDVHQRGRRRRARRVRRGIVLSVDCGLRGDRFVYTQQQRPEVRARKARFGPAADDEFLFADDLELPPVRRPLAGLIHGVGPFRNQPFPAAGERALVQRVTVRARDLADAQHLCGTSPVLVAETRPPGNTRSRIDRRSSRGRLRKSVRPSRRMSKAIKATEGLAGVERREGLEGPDGREKREGREGADGSAR